MSRWLKDVEEWIMAQNTHFSNFEDRYMDNAKLQEDWCQ
jgi:hypothetical protein